MSIALVVGVGKGDGMDAMYCAKCGCVIKPEEAYFEQGKSPPYTRYHIECGVEVESIVRVLTEERVTAPCSERGETDAARG